MGKAAETETETKIVQDLFSLWHHQQKTRVQEGVQVCQWPLCRSMVRRAQRRLRKNTARAMTWSQVRFRQVPKTKAAETETETKIVIVTGEYTSKTSSLCGTINRKLGSRKVFKCVNGHALCGQHLSHRQR